VRLDPEKDVVVTVESGVLTIHAARREETAGDLGRHVGPTPIAEPCQNDEGRGPVARMTRP
jgi:hypothetical protein